MADKMQWPKDWDFYQIDDPDETRFGRCVGMITNALTGRQTAYYAGGYDCIIGEPLCSYCDAPAADGPCGCLRSVEETVIVSRRAA